MLAGSVRLPHPSARKCSAVLTPNVHCCVGRRARILLCPGGRAVNSGNARPAATAASSSTAFAWQQRWHSRDLFQVRGTSFKQWVARCVRKGDWVLLVPEKNNPHDPHAVAIFCLAEPNAQLGYVPRELTQHFQDGVYLAEVDSVECVPQDTIVGVRVRVQRSPFTTGQVQYQYAGRVAQSRGRKAQAAAPQLDPGLMQVLAAVQEHLKKP